MSGSSYSTVDIPLYLVAYSNTSTMNLILSTGGMCDKSLGGLLNEKNAIY